MRGVCEPPYLGVVRETRLCKVTQIYSYVGRVPRARCVRTKPREHAPFHGRAAPATLLWLQQTLLWLQYSPMAQRPSEQRPRGLARAPARVKTECRKSPPRDDVGAMAPMTSRGRLFLQGYLAHKKHPPPSTLQHHT